MPESALESNTANLKASPESVRAGVNRALLVRALVFTSCLAAVGWALARAFLLPISQQAVLNAPLVELRAPIDGHIRLAVHGISARTERGAVFARIVNDLEDDGELLRVERQLAELEATRATSTQFEQHLGESRKRFLDRARSYGASKTEELSLGVAEAESALREFELTRDKQQATVKRLEPLTESGLASATELESARNELAIAEGAVATASARLRHAQAVLAAARGGAFLSSSDSGTSYAQQRNDALELQLASQALQNEAYQLQKAALEQQRQRVAHNLTQRKEQTLRVQQNGRIWELHVADGAYVTKGQVLARLVNCERQLISASVSSRVFARLSLGDRAAFQTSDKRERYEGVVRQLIGPTPWIAPVAVQLTFGAEVKGEKDARNGVVLEIDSSGKDCRVGESGEVAFGSGFWVKLSQHLSLPF